MGEGLKGFDARKFMKNMQAKAPSGLKLKFIDAVRTVIGEYHQGYIDLYPDDPTSYERQGLVYFDQKKYALAADRLTEAAELGASSPKLWRTLARSCIELWKKTGDWNFMWQARYSFENASKFVEILINPMALQEFAWILEKLGQYREAYETLDNLLNTFPKFSKRHVVLFRLAVILKYQADTLQAHERPTRSKLLMLCVEYLKELVDNTVSQNDEYINTLYLACRAKDILHTAKMQREAAKQFIELFKLSTSKGICKEVLGRSKEEWLEDRETWISWRKYFEKQQEFPLAVDAQKQAMLRVGVERFYPKTLSYEPHATQAYDLANLYFQCNQMDKAVEYMERAIELANYNLDGRDRLAEWHPEKWKPILEKQKQAQITIAKRLRGNWGRDAKLAKQNALVEKCEVRYQKYRWDFKNRKFLATYYKSKYGPLFAEQRMASLILQKAARRFLDHCRRLRKDRDLFRTRLENLKWKHKRKPFDMVIRNELALLVPGVYGVQFSAEERGVALLQRVGRGAIARAYCRRLRPELERQRVYVFEREEAAILLQRQYRRFRSNAILRSQRKLHRTRVRLSINLQRLYRNKKKSLTDLIRERAEMKAAEDLWAKKRTAAIKIQKAWRKYASGYSLETRDEASLLVQELIRGHEALMDEEEELDIYARKIQALWRGRRDRFCLRGLQRSRAPLQESRIKQLINVCVANDRHGSKVSYLTRDLLRTKDPWALPLVFDAQVVISDSHTSLTAHHAHKIAKSLDNNKTVHTLILARGEMSGEGLLNIANALRTNRGLQVLAIGPNLIGTDSPWCGALSALGTVLKGVNFHLRELIIEGNELEDSGAIHIAQAVGDFFYARYGNLEKLVLAKDAIGDRACRYLGAALSTSNRLLVMDLNGNMIHDEGARLLAEGLTLNKVLQVLNLADNDIGTEGVRAFVRSLERNHTLQTLHLENNNIKNDAVENLKDLITTNPTLQTLTLAGNLVHQDNIELLRMMLFRGDVPQTENKDDKSRTKKQLPKNWFEMKKKKLVALDRRAAVARDDRRLFPLKTLLEEEKQKKMMKNVLRPYARKRRDEPLAGISYASELLASSICSPKKKYQHTRDR